MRRREIAWRRRKGDSANYLQRLAIQVVMAAGLRHPQTDQRAVGAEREDQQHAALQPLPSSTFGPSAAWTVIPKACTSVSPGSIKVERPSLTELTA
jgi:hypothetical protein